MSRRKKRSDSRPPPGAANLKRPAAVAQPVATVQNARKRGVWGLLTVLVLAGGLTVVSTFSKPQARTAHNGPPVAEPIPARSPDAEKTTFTQPTTFEELLAVPSADLDKVDVALMNLLCAQGLPGCEDLDIPRCLATLDHWTGKIALNVEYHYEAFRRDPMESHTLAEYKMMVVMSVLSKGYGIHYDSTHAEAEYGADPAVDKTVQGLPSDKLGPDFFKETDLFFINGLLGPKRAGTCSSLPVLVYAIGKRLGYPLYLVDAFRHTFVRWDDGKERFNIETTVTGGLQVVSDYEYRQWPRSLNARMIEVEGYLQPQTSPRILAGFLYTRVGELLAHGRDEEAKKLLLKCSELVPTSKRFRTLPSLLDP